MLVGFICSVRRFVTDILNFNFPIFQQMPVYRLRVKEYNFLQKGRIPTGCKSQKAISHGLD